VPGTGLIPGGEASSRTCLPSPSITSSSISIWLPEAGAAVAASTGPVSTTAADAVSAAGLVCTEEAGGETNHLRLRSTRIQPDSMSKLFIIVAQYGTLFRVFCIVKKYISKIVFKPLTAADVWRLVVK
jgi:hypothetical protein